MMNEHTGTGWRIGVGDCLDGMRAMPEGSVDAVVTDPPYPYIKRKYGYWEEPEWRELIDDVVAECRRILKPTGSAVFIVQPTSERVGRIHPWMYRWMADLAEGWNIVQDAWWWNHTATPTVHCQRKYGLMRPSLKPCIWLGDPECFRSQDRVLCTPSDAAMAMDREDRTLRRYPGGQGIVKGRIAQTVAERGGTTPFNVLPVATTNDPHGAGTPMNLAKWWVRYMCPPDGVVLDPFCGAGTMGVAAISYGMSFVGFERDVDHAARAARRIAEVGPMFHDQDD